MGATAIHFTFSRAVVEGIIRFRTTNGDLQHSDDGRYLVLHDFTQLLLFDLARANAYHYRLEQGRQFQRVSLEGKELRMQCLSLTRPPRTVGLDPDLVCDTAVEPDTIHLCLLELSGRPQSAVLPANADEKWHDGLILIWPGSGVSAP